MKASTSFRTAILSLVLLSLQTKPCWCFQTAANSPRASFAASSSGAAPISSAKRRHRADGRGGGGHAHPSSSAPRPHPSPSRPHRRSCARLHASGDDDDDGDGPLPADAGVKFFELDDAFEDDGENVVGTKFFGGSTVKEELYVAEDEERAVELQEATSTRREEEETEYRRFEDKNAFGDALARRTGEALQSAINRVLYDERSVAGVATWAEDPSLEWETPFARSGGAAGERDSPLGQLAASRTFYNKLDVAVLSARTIRSEGGTSVVEVRWDIGAVWPTLWEARVLLTGTSTLTVREDDAGGLALLKQSDRLDGKDPRDVVGQLSSQLPPRFWDVYHIGMSPSSELDPRYDVPALSSTEALSQNKINGGKKGVLSSYRLSHLPPRLVTEPSLVDTNGREARTAEALPNHGFTTAIRTMGRRDYFVPVTPIEIGIAKEAGEGGGSVVTWTVPVPPEFASNAALPLPTTGDEDEDEEEEPPSTSGGVARRSKPENPSKFTPPSARSTRAPPAPPSDLACRYSLRPRRLVATLPYAGSPQDAGVAEARRELYRQAVEGDGFAPKLDPETGRPVFFFWMNDAKACFTRAGGLGMAVYEWRAGWSKSNEVGIELEC